MASSSSTRHILVLDDMGTPSVDQRYVNYTDFIKPSDNIRLSIISSAGSITEKDKVHCGEWSEMSPFPTRNGYMEVLVDQLHRRTPIDAIFTHSEELVLRTAHLRQMLGIEIKGLHAIGGATFRDKEVMKSTAKKGGFAVPTYQRIMAPADIIAFTNLNGYPCIVKPTLGSSSAGIHVFRDQGQRDAYLTNSFFSNLDEEGGQLDHSGDLMIECFVDGEMYHVNGHAKNGKIVCVWPFKYFSTNLEFSCGNMYGNLLIPRSSWKWDKLVDAAQKLLDVMPVPENMFFHIEFFNRRGAEAGNLDIVLCELAARRPGLWKLCIYLVGGTISSLIDSFQSNNTVGWNSIAEYEFRTSIGLQPLNPISPFCDPSIPSSAFTSSPSIADMIIPLKKGVLSFIPQSYPREIQNQEGRDIEYMCISKIGTVYRGYNINEINTCARFVSHNTHDGQHDAECISERNLNRAACWFNCLARYDPEPIAGAVEIASQVAGKIDAGASLPQTPVKVASSGDSFKDHVNDLIKKDSMRKLSIKNHIGPQ